MASYTTERVRCVRHWSEQLFSFRTTRDPGFRFENGQFVMIGLREGDRRIMRAYSIASANHEDELEFYSIKVPNGPLTSRLQHVRVGDPILISTKPTGTLVVHDLKPGRRLFMLATGTGVAPFMGLIRDPEVYERFEQIVLVRGGRVAADLSYADASVASLLKDTDLGPMAAAQLLDYPSLTREPHRHYGRITALIDQERVCNDLGLAPLEPACDRIMVCGSMRMIVDLRLLLDARGFEMSEGIGQPGGYVIERAFVEAVTPPVRRASASGG